MATEQMNTIQNKEKSISLTQKVKSFLPEWLSQFGLLELFVLIGISLYFLMTVLPLFMAFAFSLTNQNLLYKTSDFIGLDNYINLLGDRSFTRSLWMTTRLSLLVTLFSLRASTVGYSANVVVDKRNAQMLELVCFHLSDYENQETTHDRWSDLRL